MKLGWRIGELAKQVALNPKTIRYYEQIGLLPVPRRTSCAYRVYGLTDANRLRFVQSAKAFAMSLKEIRQIVLCWERGERPCPRIAELLKAKRAALATRIAYLRHLDSALERVEYLLAVSSDNTPTESICPIISERSNVPIENAHSKPTIVQELTQP